MMRRGLTGFHSRLSSSIYHRVAAPVLALVCGLVALIVGSPARAANVQGVLVYGKDSIFLVNPGPADLNLSLLVFVRDHPKSPARFAAREWGVPLLKSGQCVQIRAANVNVPVPEGCRRLVRWLLRKQRPVLFWQPTDGANGFRVVVGSTDAATCNSTAGRCTFTVDPGVRVENLTLTYTTSSLWITNGSLTPTSLVQMRLCRATNGPVCLLPVTWRPPDFDQQLDPGECVELNMAKTPPPRHCPAATSFKPPMAFWRQPFYVISPVTAYTTVCPAARRTGIQRCVVPR
jgi:hypothetical protein